MTHHLIENHRCFDGSQRVYTHWSEATQSEMRFAIYLPPAAEKKSVPALYWLSGLTCTEQNFITKAGAQHMAAELGIALIAPDTSPRGLNIPGDKEQDAFGEGASFYLDATMKPWAAHYQMYTYISSELPEFIAANFSIDKSRCGIFGHSMGGHGALTIGLKNSQLFRSMSAFSPICSLMHSPWGIHALQGYLGDNPGNWKEYDACQLMTKHLWPHGEILIDQGTADPFLTEQLKPELFAQACKETGTPVNLRMHDHYSHNYYFISTFIEDHLRFHAKNLA